MSDDMELTSDCEMTVDEIKDFNRCDTAIRTNLVAMKTCAVETGEALREMRDKRLYRRTHYSLESFVKDNYGCERNWAYRKIMYSDEVKRIASVTGSSGMLDSTKTESHVAAISKVPTADIPEVLARVRSKSATEKKRITASMITQAAKELAQPATVTKVVADNPTVERPLTDHEAAHQAIANGKPIKDSIDLARQALKIAKAIKSGPGTDDFKARMQSIEMYAKQFIGSMEVALPYSICPKCKGSKCKDCGNYGWINKQLASAYSEGRGQ